jgi:hypothetical protein
MESMADMGFKVCMAFGGHAPADSMLQDVEKKHGGRIGGMKFWGGGTLRLLRDVLAEDMRKEPRIGGHGMMWETSFVMAHRPDWVDVARAERIKENPLPSQLKNGKPETIAHIAHANAAFGEKYLALGAQRLADLAKKMLADG